MDPTPPPPARSWRCILCCLLHCRSSLPMYCRVILRARWQNSKTRSYRRIGSQRIGSSPTDAGHCTSEGSCPCAGIYRACPSDNKWCVIQARRHVHACSYLSCHLHERFIFINERHLHSCVCPNARCPRVQTRSWRTMVGSVSECPMPACADQVVAYDGRIREKPESPDVCRAYLRSYETAPACTVTSVVVTNTATGKQVWWRHGLVDKTRSFNGTHHCQHLLNALSVYLVCTDLFESARTYLCTALTSGLCHFLTSRTQPSAVSRR